MKINILLESLIITEYSKLLKIIKVDRFNLLPDDITRFTKRNKLAKNVLDNLKKKKKRN